MCLELQRSLRCLTWWHKDSSVVCDSSILGKMWVFFSSWCEPQEFPQVRLYIWEAYRNVIFLSISHPATSKVTIKGSERDSSWGGKQDSNVGGYSFGISMYHSEDHEDVEARNREAKWENVMVTGVCLHITDFLGLVAIQLLFPLTMCEHCLFWWDILSRPIDVSLFGFSAGFSVEFQRA